MRPSKRNNFKILDDVGLKYLTQLTVVLDDLKPYTFDHNTDDTTDPMCSTNDDMGCWPW